MTSKSKKALAERSVRPEARWAKQLARKIHGLSERPFREQKSVGLLTAYLAERGFSVTFPYKRIPTAVRAVWGRGRPAVGMLGEYDALPNCGSTEGAWGHGCGHNLLGVEGAVCFGPCKFESRLRHQ